MLAISMIHESEKKGEMTLYHKYTWNDTTPERATSNKPSRALLRLALGFRRLQSAESPGRLLIAVIEEN